VAAHAFAVYSTNYHKMQHLHLTCSEIRTNCAENTKIRSITFGTPIK